MKNYIVLTLRLWKLLTPFHKHFYFQLFLNIVAQLLNISITFMIARALDSVIKKDINTLLYVAVLFPITSIILNYVYFRGAMHSLKYLDNSIHQFLEEYSFKKYLSSIFLSILMITQQLNY
jgi:hypothetical protein